MTEHVPTGTLVFMKMPTYLLSERDSAIVFIVSCKRDKSESVPLGFVIATAMTMASEFSIDSDKLFEKLIRFELIDFFNP